MVTSDLRGGAERRRTGAVRLLPPLSLLRSQTLLLPPRAARGLAVAVLLRSKRLQACVRASDAPLQSGDDGMAAGEDKCGGAAAVVDAGSDLYAVLGLKKECSDAELKVAYRKLAMVSNWIPLALFGLCSWLLLHVVLGSLFSYVHAMSPVICQGRLVSRW